jgi:hypothetical protein
MNIILILSAGEHGREGPTIEGRFNPNDFSVTDLMPFSNQGDGLGRGPGFQFKEDGRLAALCDDRLYVQTQGYA